MIRIVVAIWVTLFCAAFLTLTIEHGWNERKNNALASAMAATGGTIGVCLLLAVWTWALS
jgi:uncharacterized membrane protein YjfL (UPF0719 family)